LISLSNTHTHSKSQFHIYAKRKDLELFNCFSTSMKLPERLERLRDRSFLKDNKLLFSQVSQCNLGCKHNGDFGDTLKVTVFPFTMLTDEHLYTLTRTEFAKEIGKSREAVKKDMKRGKYKDLYIFKNGKYFFKSSKAVGVSIDLSPIKLSPKKVNRGGHLDAVKKGRYPNQHLANHNHMKQLIALRGKLSASELARVDKIERMAQEEDRRERMASLRFSSSEHKDQFKNYGSGLFNWSNGGYDDPYYHNGNAHHQNPSKFTATNRGKKIIKKGPYEI